MISYNYGFFENFVYLKRRNYRHLRRVRIWVWY